MIARKVFALVVCSGGCQMLGVDKRELRGRIALIESNCEYFIRTQEAEQTLLIIARPLTQNLFGRFRRLLARNAGRLPECLCSNLLKSHKRDRGYADNKR